jgi:hypothetical protein
MILPFTLDPEVVSEYRTAPAVRSAMKRFDGPKPQGDFTYHGKSKAGGITEHRIREIQELGDLGTPYTNAVWHFSHHSSEAISELDSQISGWDFMAKFLGRGDIFKRVEGFIIRTRERILPACFAIHEADADGQAQKTYQDIYERWMKQCSSQSQNYRVEKNVASRSQKRSIRQAEIAAAQEILEGFRGDLSDWINEVQAQIQ